MRPSLTICHDYHIGSHGGILDIPQGLIRCGPPFGIAPQRHRFLMGLIYLSGGAGLTVLLGVLLCHTLFV